MDGKNICLRLARRPPPTKPPPPPPKGALPPPHPSPPPERDPCSRSTLKLVCAYGVPDSLLPLVIFSDASRALIELCRGVAIGGGATPSNGFLCMNDQT